MAQGSGGSQPESDLRRRAAWLLGALALVAVLVLVLLGLLLRTGGSHNADSPAPLDGQIGGSSSSSSAARGQSSSARHTETSTSSAPSVATSAPGRASCPGSATCALDGDVGGAADAIDAYRTQHGQSHVAVTVTAAAKACALSGGSKCDGHWAETQYSSPDGKAVVQKIQQYAHLLDPQTTAIGIGWALDPGSHQYFFATISER